MNVGDDSQRVADCCLALPLDISRLRVEINNLIFNRRIIRKRYITLVLGGKDEAKSDLEDAFSGDEQNFLDKVRRLVEENLSNPDFNVDVLSAEMNMSLSLIHISLATSCKAVACPRPIPFCSRVIQIEPPPMPTFMKSAPASTK